MQTLNRNLETRNASSNERKSSAGDRVVASQPTTVKLLFAVIGSGVLAVAGPTVSHTVTHVGLISLQILLELGRLGLAAFQIFGK